MIDNPYFLEIVYIILGLGAIVGAVKAIVWFLELRFVTKESFNMLEKDINKRFNQVYDNMEENKDFLQQKLDQQFKEILDKIEEQNKTFKLMAEKLAEISAENKIILNKLGLK